FAEFVEAKPDHPSVVTAMYWIAKAKARTGKVEQEKELMLESVKKYIAEPKREGVEQLLSQLAQVCSKRTRPPAPVAEVAKGDEAKPAPEGAEPEAFDAFAELEKWL